MENIGDLGFHKANGMKLLKPEYLLSVKGLRHVSTIDHFAFVDFNTAGIEEKKKSTGKFGMILFCFLNVRPP